ncbi:B2 bradykinin receptor-like [Sander vitreus]
MDLLPTSDSANFSTATTFGDQNNTTDKCHPVEFKDWQSTVVPAYMLLISVLGIGMNGFVLMVFCLHKKACTIAEIYLSNLAAADFFLMAWLPLWAAYAINRYDWPFSHYLCSLFSLPINMNAYCSIYFLVLISIDRYIALVHPLSHKGISRRKFAKLGCLLVWGFGLLLSIPTLVYRKVSYIPQYNRSLCFLNYSDIKEQLLFEGMQNTFGFIVPICIISYCTLIIIHSLNNRLIERSNSQKTEQKATTLVLVVLLAFVICWVPHHVVKILETLKRADVLRGCSIIGNLEICRAFFMYLAFFNSVLNPILYVIVGKNFREKVRGLFKQWSINRTMTVRFTSTGSNLTRSVRTDVTAGLF